jgi:hypothetical protein
LLWSGALNPHLHKKTLPIERFEFVAPYERLDSAHGWIRGELFIAYGIPSDKLKITEGTLLVAERADLSALEPEFTPSALAALQALSTSR